MTIRIFVGCSANGEDAEAQAMLEYTVRKHASQSVEINWMKLSRDPASPWYADFKSGQGWNTVGWATPFSAFRWAIPHVCNYEGKAIYMDVDQVAMADIAELWNQSIPNGKALLTRSEQLTCVILFDNAKMKPILPTFDQLRRTEGLYRSVRKNVGSASARFIGNWNCLDGENYKSLDDPDIKIIHFTCVETQPHLKWALPRLREDKWPHWNQNTLRAMEARPHPHPGVRPLVDRLWEEAQAAGYNVDMYLTDRFGDYNAVRGGRRAA